MAWQEHRDKPGIRCHNETGATVVHLSAPLPLRQQHDRHVRILIGQQELQRHVGVSGMMRRRRRVCAAVLVAIGLMGSGLHTTAAGETIRDEVGRVIYTIDDGGIVSMFENSPTDLTISETRGTREEMKPHVSEVVPESVQSGVATVLKLKGKNLVGASVTLSEPGRRQAPLQGL